jgi:hypothetical protein
MRFTLDDSLFSILPVLKTGAEKSLPYTYKYRKNWLET